MLFKKHSLNYCFIGFWNHFFCKIPSYSLRYFILKYLYRVSIGHSTIHINVKVFSPWKIKIGNNCNIQMNCFLDGRGGLVVCDNVDITPGVKILTLSHDINDPYYKSVPKKVVIESNSVIFSYATILPGVTIGEGCCVGAGSVVHKSTKKYSLYAGNPAVYIKKRNNNIKYNIYYKRICH